MQKSPGVQLALDAQLDPEGKPESYVPYLLNGTIHRILFEVKTKALGRTQHTKFGPLEPFTKQKLTEFPYAWLNEKLGFEIDVRTKQPTGTGPRHHQELRVKPKTFFTNYQEVPMLYREAHLYTVFPRLDASAVTTAPAAPPTLKTITKQQQARQKPTTASPNKRLVTTDLNGRAEFQEEIDLHLTSLVKNPNSIPKHQVLATQLKFFEEYLNEALKLGVDRVFIIHGLGTGVLKREIHIRLQRTPFVRKYKNEYHHKYGYGATEVIFD